ncbi:N-acetylglucosamine-1-phosphotransferase subunit gamma-like [Mya arenaria]|uniref:N-acetylglucosamine-1-phosphotransferase subunit gamma-like n=1 Tax=Mya arenaria TaxID=6604 RepID=UPI0022E71D7B|nr:N-acetylglucosamine-1-phosphotransferase subunit gamma-like [Mya arenaria]
MNSYQGGAVAETNVNKLKMRVTPSNFSGPPLFSRLNGKCFSKTFDDYKYEFCPFWNVTQHEQSLRWNPYSGILGVWQEWEIENNTFVAMVMREGDKCGNKHRTTKVYFKCGKENVITNVSEPSTCNYRVDFTTPYTCHLQALLVYPTLNSSLKTEWGLLEGQLAAGHITKKGYKKYLSQVFVKAGYMLSTETKNLVSAKAVALEKKEEANKDGQFDNLYTCTEEFRKLKKEVEDLKEQLENKNIEANHHPGVMDDMYNHMVDD